MMLHTTFRLAREAGACVASYRRFARHMGGIRAFGEDTTIPLSAVLEVLGVVDAVWCLRSVLPEQEAERDRLARLFACACAEHVLHFFEAVYPDDRRARNAIEVARRFAIGEATSEELTAASDAAWAASVAASDASVAASDAAWVARDAARDAASVATSDAEREWQAACLLELLGKE